MDEVAPTLFTFLAITMDFLPEVAKFRAARRVWATLMRDTYGARDPRSQQLRIFAFTAGSSLTAQQPMNNVVAQPRSRPWPAALAGVQTMHVSAYDEALGVPTETAANLALRTQHVVAFETGLADTVDPLAGSYAVEALTDDLERRICDAMDDIAARGGALACIESGWFAQELSDGAYRQTREVEEGDRVVVGVNRHVSPTEALEIFTVDPGRERDQAQAVARLRTSRDRAAVTAALDTVHDAAEAGTNIVGPCVDAVSAYATVGEIVARLREVHGSWTPHHAF